MNENFQINLVTPLTEKCYGLSIFTITDVKTGIEYIYVDGIHNSCMTPRLQSNEKTT